MYVVRALSTNKCATFSAHMAHRIAYVCARRRSTEASLLLARVVFSAALIRMHYPYGVGCDHPPMP